MSILAHKISIRFNIFEDNIKGKAGALSFFYPSSSAYKGVLTIEKCLFEENQALFSGGIYVHVVSQIIVLILNNIFLSNYAKQSKLIFFSKAFIIYSLFDERRCCLKFGGTFWRYIYHSCQPLFRQLDSKFCCDDCRSNATSYITYFEFIHPKLWIRRTPEPEILNHHL